MTDQPTIFDKAEAEKAKQRAEEIEELKRQKRLARLHKKKLKEHKAKWEWRHKFVAPILMVMVTLLTALVWLVSSW